MIKMFLVRIDNNPGAWKSGLDPRVIVIANSKEEAIEKVKNGWGEGWLSETDSNGKHNFSFVYGFGEGTNYISRVAQLSAMEIKFKDEDFKVISLREEKLKRITKDEKNK